MPGLGILKAIGVRGGIAIVLAIALVACWWGWSSAAADRDDYKTKLTLADAELALLRVDGELKETASEERAADTAAVAQAEKELINAIADIPDTRPDAFRVATGCRELRQAGYLDADLPAVCRPGGGGEAAPNP